jgi:hypothetical protein
MPDSYTPSSSTFPPTVPILSTSAAGVKDRIDAAVYQPSFQRISDAFAYLNSRRPQPYSATFSGSPYYTFNSPPQSLLGPHSGDFDTPERIGGYLDVPSCVVGDKVHVRISFDQATVPTFALGYASIYAIDDRTGTPVTNYVPGTNIHNPTTMLGAPITVSGVWTVAKAGTTRLTLALESNFATGMSFTMTNFVIAAVRYPAL